MDLTGLLYLILCLLLVLIILMILVLVKVRSGDQKRTQSLINQVTDEVLAAQDHALQETFQGLHQLSDAWHMSLGQTENHMHHETEQLQQQLTQSLTHQDDTLLRMLESVNQQMGLLDTRMEKLRSSVSLSVREMQDDNHRQLEQMRQTVDEKLTQSLENRLSSSFQQVSEQLEQVYKGLGEMQALASGVGDLKRVLTNVKTRGIWGEIQLGALLSEMLAPSQYAENVAVVPGSSERVEFAIQLPGKDGHVLYLPIDSKFPQESYLKLLDAEDAGDPEAIAAARKALASAIRTEAKRISNKYIKPPYTTDFALMFLPVEGLYASVVRDMEAVEAIQREQRVVIAGPTNLNALLNALQMGFRTLAIEQRTGEVWQLLGSVRREFSTFEQLLQKTQQTLKQATDSIDRAVHRSQHIQHSLSAMEDWESDPTLESNTNTLLTNIESIANMQSNL